MSPEEAVNFAWQGPRSSKSELVELLENLNELPRYVREEVALSAAELDRLTAMIVARRRRAEDHITQFQLEPHIRVDDHSASGNTAFGPPNHRGSRRGLSCPISLGGSVLQSMRLGAFEQSLGWKAAQDQERTGQSVYQAAFCKHREGLVDFPKATPFEGLGGPVSSKGGIQANHNRARP